MPENTISQPCEPDSAPESEWGSGVNLKAFCSSGALNGAMDDPFSRGEYTYATNGHIAVRVPRIESIDENAKGPDVERVLRGIVPREQMRPLKNKLPDAPPSQTMDCADCNGTGRIEHEECEDCGGHKCEACEEGKVYWGGPNQSVKIGSRLFDASYIRLIASLPGLLVAPECTDPGNPIWFRFDDGEGVLMQMNYGHEDHLDVEL